jgi:hypothetical protein
MMHQLFPLQTANPTSFTAPVVSRWASASYLLPAADGRGGSVLGRVSVNVVPTANPPKPPSGTPSISACPPSSGTCTSSDNTFIWIGYSDPDPSVRWAVNVPYYPYYSFGDDFIFPGSCCHSPGHTFYMRLGPPGAYRVKIQAMNPSLGQSQWEQVLRLGGATGTPPVARIAVDKTSGPVPLTVTYDASASSDPDGTLVDYYVSCDGKAAPSNPSPRGACTFSTSPGPYAIWLRVRDNDGNVDGEFAYIVATDGRAPSASVTSPRNGAMVPKNTQTQVTIAASAPGGVTQVELTVNGVLTCSMTASPYACSWKVPPQKNAKYQLQAKAYDAQGGFGVSEINTVTAK